MIIVFDIPGEPPRTTAQQARSGTSRNGRHYHYKTAKLKEAEAHLIAGMLPHRPKKPMEGALELYVRWYFDAAGRRKEMQPKTTRPDTDNLQKLLKDCLTQCGFWHDDAQVYYEEVEKRWSEKPRIEIMISDDAPGLTWRREECLADIEQMRCLLDCANCVRKEGEDG